MGCDLVGELFGSRCGIGVGSEIIVGDADGRRLPEVVLGVCPALFRNRTWGIGGGTDSGDGGADFDGDKIDKR